MSTNVKISAKEVNKLRKLTGAGMMDCKKALVETGGDMEAAIEHLRKKGQKVAAKRADRDTTEGAAIALTSEDGTKGVIIVLGCETDFVAKNDSFVALATAIAGVALTNLPADKEGLLAADIEGQSVAERLTSEIGKIGEKIEVDAYEKLEGEAVVPYIHAGNRIGVLVALNQAITDDISGAGKDVAMQVAAMSPVALDESDVPQSVIDQELKVGREIALQQGKPEHIIDRIAQGNLKKFMKDNTLLHQQFVKNNKLSVKDYISSVSKGLAVTAFKRAAIG